MTPTSTLPTGDTDVSDNGYQTTLGLAESRRHLLWPAFDEWVSENGVTFRTTSHRLNTWRAFLAGYMLRAEHPVEKKGKVKT